MIRFVTLGLLVMMIGFALCATVSARLDDGPPISIVSPQTGTTYAFASLKNRALIWDSKKHLLAVRVTFVQVDQSIGGSGDDQHEFTLPGVNFDEAKGLFFALTAKGEKIPVAQEKKALFFKSIEVLPNARIRIIHPRGDITVILEAISPNDPAMHPAPVKDEADGTRKVDLNQVMN